MKNAIESSVRIAESRVTHQVVEDISPEMVVVSMWIVDAYSRARGRTPDQEPLPSHVRKRLLGTV